MTIIEQSLLNIFEQKGIFLSETEKDNELEMDSIQFISLIVEIESAFSISIADEDLLFDKFSTFNSFLRYIEILIAQNTKMDTKVHQVLADTIN